MKKYIHDLKVISNNKISGDYCILELQNEQPLPEILPGQFAEVKVDHNPKVFLRRPLSIHDVDYQKNTISLLIRIIGQGTLSLSQLQAGSILNLVYPLGNSFGMEGVKKPLLIGGGCGIAPLLYLARKLNENGIEITTLYGGKSSCDIFERELFEKYGRLAVSTDDGSLGEKGFLTNHSIMQNPGLFDKVFCCGPLPMMKLVAGIAEKSGVECEVSLENTMACGIGVCLCCVTSTTGGNKCVCTEGPVFNSKQLKW